MGKKSKKKGGGRNTGRKGKNTNNNNAGGSQQQQQQKKSNKNKPGNDSDQTSLYKIYKYCTEAVIQWGKVTHEHKTKKGGKGGGTSTKTLSHVIFNILGDLAEDGVLMPQLVLNDLKLAIMYRKRVGRYYRSLPHVRQDDIVRHEWLIEQLEKLARAFRRNNLSHRKKNMQELSMNDDTDDDKLREGFEVLFLSDDEDEDEDDDKEEEKESIQDDRQPRTQQLKTPPTPEELEAEERLFAISLLMFEVDDLRNNLRNRWIQWAEIPRNNSDDDDDDDDTEGDYQAGQDLFGITASTQYALSAIRKLVLQVSIETDFDNDMDTILAGMEESVSSSSSSSSSTNRRQQQNFQRGDLVTLQGLKERPELNGRSGVIIRNNVLADKEAAGHVGRMGVELADPKTQEPVVFSIKPENLLLSDDTYLRLCQIKSAFDDIDLNNFYVPSSPPMTYGAPASSSVQNMGMEMMMQHEKFHAAARNQDFATLLQLLIKYALPVWISLSQYLPDVGAADAVLNAYIRDYYVNTKKLTFPLAFAVLVAMDTAMAATTRGYDKSPTNTNIRIVNLLGRVVTTDVYTQGIRALDGAGMKPGALYSHFEFIRHMKQEYAVCGFFFPLVMGELLLSSLRMHLVCGSGLPYAFVGKYTNVLHIYWMLRCEGILGRIPELEDVISIYRQSVFFRGGLAAKGQENYLKCQQLAHGVSASALKFIDGKAVAPKTKLNQASLTMEGLHVSEISRLLDVLQWKSTPILDKDACFNEIEVIAKEEYKSLFTGPLLEISCKLSKLIDALSISVLPRAKQSGPRMMLNFDLHTSRMTPIDLICFWAMAMGDNRSIIPGEKEECFRLLGFAFHQIFFGGIEEGQEDEPPTPLKFSRNDHKVDSSLWGEKGVRKVEHLQV